MIDIIIVFAILAVAIIFCILQSLSPKQQPPTPKHSPAELRLSSYKGLFTGNKYWTYQFTIDDKEYFDSKKTLFATKAGAYLSARRHIHRIRTGKTKNVYIIK